MPGSSGSARNWSPGPRCTPWLPAPSCRELVESRPTWLRSAGRRSRRRPGGRWRSTGSWSSGGRRTAGISRPPRRRGTPRPRIACLVERCITPLAGPDGQAVAEVAPAVREAATAAMGAADPLAEVLVDIVCPACGTSFVADLDVAGFVWSEMTAWAHRVLRCPRAHRRDPHPDLDGRDDLRERRRHPDLQRQGRRHQPGRSQRGHRPRCPHGDVTCPGRPSTSAQWSPVPTPARPSHSPPSPGPPLRATPRHDRLPLCGHRVRAHGDVGPSVRHRAVADGGGTGAGGRGLGRPGGGRLHLRADAPAPFPGWRLAKEGGIRRSSLSCARHFAADVERGIY
jgi:hypothetical protein